MSDNAANLLAYYQKNAKEAFEKGFTNRIHYECVDSEVYEVHKYYLPVHASKKVKWVRRYFKTLDSLPIDITYKRRKHWVEFAETSFMILSRIFHLCNKGYKITAGSTYVSPVAWAIFGEGDSGCMARHQFSNVLEIANHYRNALHGNCYPIDLYFKMGHSHWAAKMGARFKKSPLSSANFWMTVALLLTYDIIHECGPDCDEFFELFTNDYRDSSDNFDVAAWEQLRCKILGVSGRVDTTAIPRGGMKIHFVGPIQPQRKPFKAKTEVRLLSESNDLAAGEKTYPTLIKSDNNARHGACCPLPIPPNLWPEDIAVGVHGLGLRLRGAHGRFHMGCTPDMM